MKTYEGETTMANDNSISIGSIGNSNHIHIEQLQQAGVPRIKYEPVAASLQHMSREAVFRGTIGYYASWALLAVPLLADGLGILGFFGVQTLWAVVAVLPFVGAATTNPQRKIAEAPFSPGVANFIGNQWVERDEGGDYVLYRKTARCTYPGCNGDVVVRPAPERERPNHTLVGECSVGGKQHTYTIDFNGHGLPRSFDWRELEERAS
jgi:hypothetical protein